MAGRIHALNRFTDFLVYEVDLDGNVIHIKSLSPPEVSPTRDKSTLAVSTPSVGVTTDEASMQVTASNATDSLADGNELTVEPTAKEQEATAVPKGDKSKSKDDNQHMGEPWPERFNTALTPFLSPDAITEVKKMFLEGPEPPRVSDSGWGGRQPKVAEDGTNAECLDMHLTPETHDNRGKGGRGGRGGRGRGQGGRSGSGREDRRKVLSDVRLPLLVPIIIFCDADLISWIQLADLFKSHSDCIP